jgi:hypothetical protein
MPALLQLVRRTIRNGPVQHARLRLCARVCVRAWCSAELERRSASGVQQVEWDLYGALAQAPENIDVRNHPHGLINATRRDCPHCSYLKLVDSLMRF